MSGRTVLEIRACYGLLSFEAERRGAARVLATASFWLVGAGLGSKACFQLARRVLQSCVTDMDIDVMEMTPQAVGVLDVVLFLGVLYHLRHPLPTLEKVSSVASEMLVLSRWVDLTNVDRPAAAFYPETEPEGDPSNWWRLNHTA